MSHYTQIQMDTNTFAFHADKDKKWHNAKWWTNRGGQCPITLMEPSMSSVLPAPERWKTQQRRDTILED